MKDSEVHKILHEFKDRHYSSNAMTLTVQSQETLDTLQKWVEESFNPVPNNGKEFEKFHHLNEPFKTEKFHKMYKLSPVQNIYQVDLNWALKPLLDQWKVKPLHYMSWIVGHEGN